MASSSVPAVARMGPPVRALTWVPVAKMSSAMNGSALSWNRAVVKLPISRAPGANVPMSAPSTSGISMSPPGMRCMVANRGTRDVS